MLHYSLFLSSRITSPIGTPSPVNGYLKILWNICQIIRRIDCSNIESPHPLPPLGFSHQTPCTWIADLHPTKRKCSAWTRTRYRQNHTRTPRLCQKGARENINEMCACAWRTNTDEKTACRVDGLVDRSKSTQM